MAKDSFIVYSEWEENVSALSDEEAGVLLKALFRFVNDGEIPKMDAVTEMCFRFLKAQIERDSRKYEERKTIRSEAGKKGAEARWQNGKNGKRISANGKNALYVDVNEDVNVDVNDDDDDVKKEKRKKIIDDAERKRLEERDRILEEDDYEERHEGAGEVYFNPTIKLGMKSAPSSKGTMSQEERERILKRLEDFQKRKEG